MLFIYIRSLFCFSLRQSSAIFSLFHILYFSSTPYGALAVNFNRISPATSTIRCFATRQTTSSFNDSNHNLSNRPPKETILLEGCDFEHWLIVMEKPQENLTRDEIIDSYIKTLATVVGSEDEARMKIYSVSTRNYFAFGALISEELSYKMKGEPYINGQAVPYDPKYHVEWERNNARANERNRRNDQSRNFDRSRSYERRRENTQQQNQQAHQGPGSNNMGGPPNMGRSPQGMGGPPNMGVGPQGMGGPQNMGGGPPGFGGPQNMGGGRGMGGPMGRGGPPNPGGMQHNNMGGAPPPNYTRGPQPTIGGMAPNNIGNFQHRNTQNNQGFAHQSGPGPNTEYKNSYPTPNMGYQVQDMPGRDMPPSNYQ